MTNLDEIAILLVQHPNSQHPGHLGGGRVYSKTRARAHTDIHTCYLPQKLRIALASFTSTVVLLLEEFDRKIVDTWIMPAAHVAAAVPNSQLTCGYSIQWKKSFM